MLPESQEHALIEMAVLGDISVGCGGPQLLREDLFQPLEANIKSYNRSNKVPQ